MDLLGIAINRFIATVGETRLGKLFNSSEIEKKYIDLYFIKQLLK